MQCSIFSLKLLNLVILKIKKSTDSVKLLLISHIETYVGKILVSKGMARSGSKRYRQSYDCCSPVTILLSY